METTNHLWQGMCNRAEFDGVSIKCIDCNSAGSTALILGQWFVCLFMAQWQISTIYAIIAKNSLNKIDVTC